MQLFLLQAFWWTTGSIPRQRNGGKKKERQKKKSLGVVKNKNLELKLIVSNVTNNFASSDWSQKNETKRSDQLAKPVLIVSLIGSFGTSATQTSPIISFLFLTTPFVDFRFRMSFERGRPGHLSS